MTDSLWSATCALPHFPPLEGDTKTHVVIIGGGLAGVLTAHALAEAGIDHLLVESRRLCSGISRNTTAKLTAQHALIYHKLIKEFGTETARLYWEANQTALDRYHILCQTIPCDYEGKSAYVYSTRGRERLEGELSALERLGIPADFVDDLPLPFPTSGGIRFQNQGQFHPLKFVAGLLPGLNIRERTTALSVEENRVVTDRGRIYAPHIIIATHFPFLNKHGLYFLKLYQDRSYVLALKDAPDVEGMYIDEAKGGLSFRNHGSFLLLGGGAHHTGKPSEGWAALEGLARRSYPSARVKYRWAAQDCMTLDGLPYIGRYSRGTHNLYVATGFQKWGMTSSMVAASILRDMVSGKENPYAQVFSPSRSMLRPQLLVNAANATVNLLTPTAPRCPHMGCALKWNERERSWDCPCHGSRFTEDGERLDNPATGDLKGKL